MDSGLDRGAQPILNVKLPLAVIIAGIALLAGLGVMAVKGFNDNGLRLASELDWRFTCFVFFAAAIAGPLCRLAPYSLGKSLGALPHQLIWSVCACHAVYLAVLLLPNLLGGVTPSGQSGGTMVFAIFSGVVVAVMAYAVTREAGIQLGEAARGALLSVAATFFWLTYALTGLAHISGPHRPDAFYGISLGLMILVLLLRFADRFVARLRGGAPVPSL